MSGVARSWGPSGCGTAAVQNPVGPPLRASQGRRSFKGLCPCSVPCLLFGLSRSLGNESLPLSALIPVTFFGILSLPLCFSLSLNVQLNVQRLHWKQLQKGGAAEEKGRWSQWSATRVMPRPQYIHPRLGLLTWDCPGIESIFYCVSQPAQVLSSALGALLLPIFDEQGGNLCVGMHCPSSLTRCLLYQEQLASHCKPVAEGPTQGMSPTLPTAPTLPKELPHSPRKALVGPWAAPGKSWWGRNDIPASCFQETHFEWGEWEGPRQSCSARPIDCQLIN